MADYEQYARNKATEYGLDPDLVHRMISQESAYKPDAVSPKGAVGLMQLMPGTASDMGVKNPKDPYQNIDGGVKYLAQLVTKYDGDTTKAVAAYNAGPKRVDKVGGIPNIPETQNYVKKVVHGGIDFQADPESPDSEIDFQPVDQATPAPAPTTKSEPGFVEKTSKDISKRFKNIANNKGQNMPVANPLGMPIGDLGQYAGMANDVIGNSISSLYKTIMPEKSQAGLKGLANAAVSTPMILDEGMPTDMPGTSIADVIKAIASPATAAYGEFKKADPGTAYNLEGAGNIISLLPFGKGKTAADLLAADANKAAILAGQNTIESNMYKRALKPSTTLKAGEVDKRVNTALNEGIPVTSQGLEKSKAAIKEINTEITDRIAAYTEQGATVNANKVASNAEENMLGEIINKEAFPEKPLTQASDVLTEFRANAPGEIPIQTAQNYKVSINRELDDFYKAMSSSPDKTAALSQKWTNKTKAALADELRAEIANIFPEVSSLNKREGSLIQLNKSLERAVNRISNKELISLKGFIGLVFHPKYVFMNYIVNNSTVQSKLAVAIRQARLKGYTALPGNAVKMFPTAAQGVTQTGKAIQENYNGGTE